MKKLIFIVCLTVTAAQARTIYVNPDAGSDSADGNSVQNPVHSIARGIALAQPGDTVDLGGFIYKNRGEQVGIYFPKTGKKGSPITIDGHGATIDGAKAVEPNQWTQSAPGLYKNTTIFQKWAKVYKGDPAWQPRFFFLINGKINRMNISLKAPAHPYLKTSELHPGEWTFIKSEGAHYFKTDAGKTISDYSIEAPDVISGVQISGDVHYVIFKNITAAYVLNDGFGLTTGGGKSTVSEIFYENIRAIECGDDGFSAHGDCDVHVDGFYIDGCSTGIANQGNSVNNRVETRNIHGVDILFGSGTHVLTNSRLFAQGRTGSVIATFWPNPHGQKPSSLKLDKVLIEDPAGARLVKVDPNCILNCSNVTARNITFTASAGSILNLHKCSIDASSCKFKIDSKASYKNDSSKDSNK